MNWNQDIQRINTVFWGFWIAFGLLAVVARVIGALTNGLGMGEIAIVGAVGTIAAWVAHKVSRWVISDFFSA